MIISLAAEQQQQQQQQNLCLFFCLFFLSPPPLLPIGDLRTSVLLAFAVDKEKDSSVLHVKYVAPFNFVFSLVVL